VAGLDGGTSHATRSLAACRRCLDCAAQPQRYLTNDEAAEYLRLSPRTLEKQRVIGGGPKFRKFGRRVMYAVADLDAWATERSFEATSDPEYAERHAATPCADRWRAVAFAMSSPRCHGSALQREQLDLFRACRATWRRATART
jgi:hypothetical protein